MSDLNENHRRKVLTTCQYVDDLLTEALGRIVPNNPKSPLQSFIADATPEQVQVLRQELEELRTAMVDVLRKNKITIPSPQISAMWAFRTALVEADEVVFDLQARLMSRYGALNSEAQQRLDETAAQLMRQLQKFTEVLNHLTIQQSRPHHKEMEES